MNKGFTSLVFLLSGVLVVILLAGLDPDHPHRFAGACNTCHLGLADPGMLIGDINLLCARCHQNRTTRSHPSGFTPTRELPGMFPTTGGRMVCVTCHLPHPPMGDSGAGPVGGGMNPYMLRYPEAGKRLCPQGHPAESFGAGSSHTVSLGLAHRMEPDPEAVKLLDRSSVECLACHDGTVSSNVERGGASWNHAGGIGLSHPIGVVYQDAVRRPDSRLHPERSLPEALTLVNGQVECVTCHDHYSSVPGLLVMDNSGSRLCLSCHNL